MATYRNVGEFHQGVEDWKAYTERLDHYFMANDIVGEGNKSAILLSMCGPTMYGFIQSLVSPKKATEFTYEELVKKVAKHFNLVPSATMQ